MLFLCRIFLQFLNLYHYLISFFHLIHMGKTRFPFLASCFAHTILMSSIVSFGVLGLGMITLVDMNGKWGAGLATVTKGLMAGLLVGHPVGIKAVHLVSG